MKKNSSLLVWFIHSSPLILKTILLGLFGISLYASYTFLTSDPPGYCGEQKRFLSDEEFIEIAVRNEASSGRMKIDGSEESIRTFHAMHPGCCDVARGDSRNLLEKVFSARYVVTVQLVYEANENVIKQMEGRFYENYPLLDVCGQGHGSGFRGGLSESEYNIIVK